jgi:hypothetical protein
MRFLRRCSAAWCLHHVQFHLSGVISCLTTKCAAQQHLHSTAIALQDPLLVQTAGLFHCLARDVHQSTTRVSAATHLDAYAELLLLSDLVAGCCCTACCCICETAKQCERPARKLGVHAGHDGWNRLPRSNGTPVPILSSSSHRLQLLQLQLEQLLLAQTAGLAALLLRLLLCLLLRQVRRELPK